MELNFGHIFENLGLCKSSTRIIIENKKLTAKDEKFFTVESSPISFWTFGMKKRKVQAQNKETVGYLINLVQKTAHSSIAPTLVSELTELQKSGNKLTAGHIRSIYRRVIASNLTKSRKTACLSHSRSDRIIFNKDTKNYGVHNISFNAFRSDRKNENRLTIQHFYKNFVSEWGQERVDRALAKYDINLKKMHAWGKPLTVKTINKISLGVSDFYAEDLHLGWNRIQKICKGESKIESLPKRERRKLMGSFGVDNGAALLSNIQSTFGPHVGTAYDSLPPAIHTLLSTTILLNAKELEHSFQGKRIEGVITGYPPLSLKYFIYPKAYEDQERLQLYQTIFSLKSRVVPEAIEKAYNELLAKAMVKKHMLDGTLVPAPPELTKNDFGATFYQLEKKIITGRGKYALNFSQMHENGHKLPDILLYRSTCSIPVMQDAFTTVATDAFPFRPPGYLERYAGKKEEDEILFKRLDTPLKILGHSLGGSHTQLFLINRLKKKGKNIECSLPNRNIELITFDSPALKASDSKMCSQFLSNPANAELAKRIAIQFYFSSEDLIPGGGGLHIGVGVAKEALNTVNCFVLDALNLNSSPLKLHPHGRFYYLTRPEVDFKERSTEIETFNQRNWRKTVEVIRKVTGTIIFPPVMILGYTKRFFLGWRDHPSGIRIVYNKVLGKTYSPKVKVKNYGLPKHIYTSLVAQAA